VAGILSAMRMIKGDLGKQKILFLGAGEAGIGIGNLIVTALTEQGMPENAARKICWYVDSKGLVVKRRTDLTGHKRPYAHDHQRIADFTSAVNALKPTAIIGVSGQTGAFTQSVLEAMAIHNDRPIIFALSNPTSRSECTPEEAYRWTRGRAVFACGSPFAPVTINGETFMPGQGNNEYIFPGVGLGVIASQSRCVTDEMFLVAAKTLVEQASQKDYKVGSLFPPLTRIRAISATIAMAVADVAYNRGFAATPRPKDLATQIRFSMHEPVCGTYV
jgi:malate dehydrogenase (oxaloacetate-decarboxylating)(NADP+)